MAKKKIILGIMSFVILFLVLVAYKESKVFEKPPKQEDFMYAYYINDVVANDMPAKDSGLVLSSKSNCNNGVTISWDSSTWSAIVNYQNYKSESKRTECNLYFESPSYLRKVKQGDNNGMWKEKANITKLIIQNKLNPIENAELESDESEKRNGSIMSYLVKNEDNATYTAYLQSNGMVHLNYDSSFLFYFFSSLENIVGIEYLDTSHVERMQWMFWGTSSLSSLDVSHFDTSKVTNMSGMFMQTSSLTSLDVGKFDTSNVTDMSYMFKDMSNLTSLDVSHFDTSKVIDMNSMFQETSSLTSLDLSNFDTSNVTDMRWMFLGTSKLSTVVYGSKFVYANNANVLGMYNNSIALKPTHESWSGVV